MIPNLTTSNQSHTSLADGFLMALLGSVPLLATAAMPFVGRPLTDICLAAAGLVAVNWVLVPLGRLAWVRARGGSPRLVSARYPRPR